MSEKTKPAATPWTDQDRDLLRSKMIAGEPIRAIAAALGRTESAVSTTVNRLGLQPMRRIPAATQVRIRDLAGEGWQSSRIARRLQLPVEVVERYSVSA
ncbi:hypothetical protein [Aureimonas glaciei]|uniref:Uncharacterized protein n=1 Tax=Aureimonas glaciei TaxID=1776957 RepID=A0A916YG43_9HYPH|nr:hypothetical protein [Aureimonas glaciei]GGD43886.1 hypothetical protein GCM10011335_53130 [Aureimonas glaciei]